MKRGGEPIHRHKLILYSHSAELLGAERALLMAVQYLVERDITVLVVLPRRGPLTSRVSELGAQVTRCPMPWWLARTKAWPVFFARLLGAAASFPRLLWITARFQPCTACTNSWVTPEGALAARLLRISHVWIIREYEPGNETLRSQLPIPLIRRLTQRWSTEVLAVSSSVAGQLSVGGKDIQVVRVGSTLDTTEPTRPADAVRWLRDGSPGLLVIGSISVAKGTIVAVQAMAALCAWLPDARLLVAGNGTPAMMRSLQAAIEENSLHDRVRIEPFTQDVASLMRASDVLVMPSRHEAYGLVTVEAMSLGLPVVGTATGGTRELLTLGGGLLAGLEQPRHFASHIYAIATDDDLRTWLSERGRAVAAGLPRWAEGAALEEAIRRLCPLASRNSGYRGSKPAV